jgi:hypothetical protein
VRPHTKKFCKDSSHSTAWQVGCCRQDYCQLKQEVERQLAAATHTA